MLFYSIFPKEKLCIFQVGESLTLKEMKKCYEDLMLDSHWHEVDTAMVDLRQCREVDVSFVNDTARLRVENQVFGHRKVVWLTGEAKVLGELSMAAAMGGRSILERYQFSDVHQMERFFGGKGERMMECLQVLE